EVHMLSAQAFNAFLKTLEEPPAYAVFILATTEKHKIIPTILSRCQIFDFRRIQVADMVAHLQQIGSQENIAAEETALHIIAQKADGALRDALSIFDRIVSGLPPEGKDKKTLTYKSVIESLNVLDYDYYFKVLDALLAEDRAQVMLLFDKIQRNGFEADTFILGLAEHIRNVLVCKDEQTLALLEMSEDLKKRYEAQANLCSPDFLLSLLNIANNCDVHYKMARNKRLHVEMALLKMTYVNRAINTSYTPATDTPKTPPNTQKKNTEISSPLSNNNNPANTYTTPPPPVEQLKEPSPTPPKKEVKQSTPMQQKEPIAKLADSKLPEELRHKAIRQIPKLDSLDALDKEIENEAPLVQLQLNIETLQEVWTAYTKQIDSPTTRMTFQQVKLAVEDNTIQVSVPSSMSKSMIIAESQLLPFLRSHLKNNRLVLEIKIDASLAPASQEKEKAPKAFSLKEKYHAMRKVNPLVDDLVERFGLKPE
ncbi:MAG TPA: DNA polymerase III subunit gamma/tau, partial [Phaeodactylibacter sp.]|nr:DNA polymerase III subunit gamma/tau [Phaeodactylibacter sp.]